MQVNNLAAAARHHQEELLREAQEAHLAREAREALEGRTQRPAARGRIMASLTARLQAFYAAAEPRIDPIEMARRQEA